MKLKLLLLHQHRLSIATSSRAHIRIAPMTCRVSYPCNPEVEPLRAGHSTTYMAVPVMCTPDNLLQMAALSKQPADVSALS